MQRFYTSNLFLRYCQTFGKKLFTISKMCWKHIIKMVIKNTIILAVRASRIFTLLPRNIILMISFSNSFNVMFQISSTAFCITHPKTFLNELLRITLHLEIDLSKLFTLCLLRDMLCQNINGDWSGTANLKFVKNENRFYVSKLLHYQD